jgi:adenosylhomocysteine nucleosidase
LLSKTYFEVQAPQFDTALSTASVFAESLLNDKELIAAGINAPKVYGGDVASGDKFFASSCDRKELLGKLPDTLCVEMEGAAVAQVCYEYDLPFSVIRFISDDAGDNSHLDFPVFLEKVAGRYSAGIIRELFRQQK